MEILVGKGGNQSMPIADEQVSRIHCKIEVMDSGHIAVTNLSAGGTWLNGTRLVKRTLVKPQDTLRLGPTFTATIEQLTVTTDYDTYTCHQAVLRKYPTARELQVFINTSAKHADSQMAPYVMPVVKSAMAFCLIEEGKYWEAQSLIYEAGDTLYDLQDGSELLQGIYASMLTVCARLYVAVHRLDVALEAINGALSIFDRLPAGCTGATDEQREEAQTLAMEISTQAEN
jgi:hypothetical protein